MFESFEVKPTDFIDGVSTVVKFDGGFYHVSFFEMVKCITSDIRASVNQSTHFYDKGVVSSEEY